LLSSSSSSSSQLKNQSYGWAATNRRNLKTWGYSSPSHSPPLHVLPSIFHLLQSTIHPAQVTFFKCPNFLISCNPVKYLILFYCLYFLIVLSIREWRIYKNWCCIY
jgi:hypothetical protein